MDDCNVVAGPSFTPTTRSSTAAGATRVTDAHRSDRPASFRSLPPKLLNEMDLAQKDRHRLTGGGEHA